MVSHGLGSSGLTESYQAPQFFTNGGCLLVPDDDTGVVFSRPQERGV